MQFSDIITEAGASKLTTTDDFDYDGVNLAINKINKDLENFRKNLNNRGIEETEIRYFVEARYRFQVWELEIELKNGEFKSETDIEDLIAKFHQMHERVFAIIDEGQTVECLNWRGRLIGKVDAPSLEPSRTSSAKSKKHDREKETIFDGKKVKTSIYKGEALSVGDRISGPAVVEEPTSTLVVYPGSSVVVSGGGRYIISLKGLIQLAKFQK